MFVTGPGQIGDVKMFMTGPGQMGDVKMFVTGLWLSGRCYKDNNTEAFSEVP